MSVANKHLRKDQIKIVLRRVSRMGYERFRGGDYRYVRAEATNGWMDADWPVSANDMRRHQGCLAHVPAATKVIKIERRRIPVEKGGGGV